VQVVIGKGSSRSITARETANVAQTDVHIAFVHVRAEFRFNDLVWCHRSPCFFISILSRNILASAPRTARSEPQRYHLSHPCACIAMVLPSGAAWTTSRNVPTRRQPSQSAVAARRFRSFAALIAAHLRNCTSRRRLW
jgi:hypothetical protein